MDLIYPKLPTILRLAAANNVQLHLRKLRLEGVVATAPPLPLLRPLLALCVALARVPLLGWLPKVLLELRLTRWRLLPASGAASPGRL